ncbi:glycolate oxidase subunit GlcE [Candidatus Albibeggiatoa sp. nov. NOAA]|uniref:glycolate oxidase subunit GlcE n=1 Tax=Candidatus Albibeggiatoa sp. nov. NOAA TaxID=3162724 RepID=UPI0032F97ECD|nr:glycolate oxidase subunit GlcE [Thiotrichaceae bacterium]
MSDISQQLQTTIEAAFHDQTALQIVGSNSKHFYGRQIDGQQLDVSQHTGIVSYEPTELVVTARAGTPIVEIQQALAEKGQQLAFEPPLFSDTATLGGTIACGFSGSARPYVGAARDFVLGVKCINGEGKLLNFGGQVMKNVAGYDVSRLMVGALGTLGVLLEVSCKVLPLPEETTTVTIPVNNIDMALETMLHWHNQAIPLTASCFDGNNVYLRLSGTAIQDSVKQIGADVYEQGEQFWQDLREHRLNFFQQDKPLWRISLPINTPDLKLEGQTLLEWSGALRWLSSDLDAETIRAKVTQAGGHATLFRGGDRQGQVFQPLDTALLALQKRLKQQFDPKMILNRGKMFAEI